MRSVIAGVGRGQRDQAAAFGDIDTALPGGAEYAGQRLRQLAQLAERVLDVAVAGDAHLDAVAVDGAAGEWNAGLAQHAQHVVGEPCSRSLRTALASTSSRRLEPPCRSRPSTMWRCAQDGQLRSVFSGKKFGTAKRHTMSAVSRMTRRLPPREKQHRCDCPRYGRAAPASGLPVSSRSRPSPARPWRAPRRPSGAFAAPARRRRSRTRSGRRRPPW